MNNNINFIKNIDNLGRVVIPMDIRRKLNINTGDVLSITCNENGINLSKYSSLDSDYKIIETIKYFIEAFNINIILMDKETVKYSNIVDINSKLDNNLKSKIMIGTTIKYTNDSIVIGNKKITGTFNMNPIVTNEGIIGSIIVVGDNLSKSYEICNLISKIIMLYLNIS